MSKNDCPLKLDCAAVEGFGQYDRCLSYRDCLNIARDRIVVERNPDFKLTDDQLQEHHDMWRESQRFLAALHVRSPEVCKRVEGFTGVVLTVGSKIRDKEDNLIGRVASISQRGRMAIHWQGDAPPTFMHVDDLLASDCRYEVVEV